MKRLVSFLAVILICAVLLMPLAAFAESDTVTTGAIDYTKYTPAYSITDADGSNTKAFSLGVSCGMNGITLFTGHDYSINFTYAANDSSAGEPPVADVKITNCDPEMQAKYLSVENGSVKVKAGDERYAFTVVLVENGEETDKALSFNVAKYKVDFTDILLLGIGVYALVTAITGTGSMFKNEYIKDGMEDKFKKTVRIAAAVVGLAMLGVAAISILAPANEGLTWVKYALFGIGVVALIGSLIMTARMTDKDKRAKAQATAKTGGPTNSAAAFEFDEDEPTLDDVLAQLNKEDGSGSSDNAD